MTSRAFARSADSSGMLGSPGSGRMYQSQMPGGSDARRRPPGSRMEGDASLLVLFQLHPTQSSSEVAGAPAAARLDSRQPFSTEVRPGGHTIATSHAPHR